MKIYKKSFSLTNWTFGIWWGPMPRHRPRHKFFGIDFGPFEIVWRGEIKK